MPLSKHFGGHGAKVMAEMKKRYGAKRGKRIFYATENKQKQSYEDGGVVKKTGDAKVHKGEVVVPKDHPQRDAIAEMLERAERGQSARTMGEEAGMMSRLRRRKRSLAGGD
jgi:hypothetical protein